MPSVSQTASRKATGFDSKPVALRLFDEVLAELFKAGGETVLERMQRICVAIWETGEWPEEWTFSTFIPLPKKGCLKQCAHYHMQTRSFLDHTEKDLSEGRNRNCRQTGGIPTRKGDKRTNHETQNTDARGTQTPATTLYVLCGPRRHLTRSPMINSW